MVAQAPTKHKAMESINFLEISSQSLQKNLRNTYMQKFCKESFFGDTFYVIFSLNITVFWYSGYIN
jgi:hypothetical protein